MELKKCEICGSELGAHAPCDVCSGEGVLCMEDYYDAGMYGPDDFEDCYECEGAGEIWYAWLCPYPYCESNEED